MYNLVHVCDHGHPPVIGFSPANDVMAGFVFPIVRDLVDAFFRDSGRHAEVPGGDMHIL